MDREGIPERRPSLPLWAASWWSFTKKKIKPSERVVMALLEDLPRELLVLIALHLALKEVLRLSETCQTCYKACQDSLLWKELFRKRFCSLHTEDTEDWKALFIQYSMFIPPLVFVFTILRSTPTLGQWRQAWRFAHLRWAYCCFQFLVANNRWKQSGTFLPFYSLSFSTLFQIRCVEEFAPGSGYHYVEFLYKCPSIDWFVIT